MTGFYVIHQNNVKQCHHKLLKHSLGTESYMLLFVHILSTYDEAIMLREKNSSITVCGDTQDVHFQDNI